MTYTTEQVLERFPSPPGAPLGYAEFWVSHAERNRDEWYLLWQRIIFRDGRVCWYCKRRMSLLEGRSGTLDHVVPKVRGGSDHFTNLRGACEPCNLTKGRDLPEETLGTHTCRYPDAPIVAGEDAPLCFICQTPRSKQGRKAAHLAAARRAVGPHECHYEPKDDPDALCVKCSTSRSKTSRKALNRRLRLRD